MKKSFALFFIGALLVSGCQRSIGEFDHLAQCLTDKGMVMYGNDSCSHCIEQKKDFKGSFDLITYIQCNQEPGKCQDQSIQGTPTWIMDGKKYEGRQSLSHLAEIAGCQLSAETMMAEDELMEADEMSQ